MAWTPMKFEVKGLSPGAFNIIDPEFELWEGDPENPTEMINVGETWGVNVRWRNSGWILNFLAPGMTWYVECLLEQHGPPEGPTLPEKTVAFQVGYPPTKSYSATLQFPPPVVPKGKYDLVISIGLRLSAIDFPAVASGEGPMVTFYPGP
jgi:hypothetical protein